MNQPQESMIYSLFRSFFTALMGTMGAGIAIVAVILMIASLAKDSDQPDRTYKVKILSDADGKRQNLGKTDPVILQINIDGMIGLKDMTAEKVQRLLVESREGDLKNDRVKAIFLYINTPGGTVTDSDGIYQALMEYKNRYGTPIFAYIGGVGASGGYMIASAADRVYAGESGLIGSIGVVSPSFFNVSDVLAKMGVKTQTLFAGKGKDAMNPFRPWSEGEDKTIQAIIDDYYQQFIQIVTRGRPNLTKDKLINEYGARVFSSQRALENGYIDAIVPTSSDALRELARTIVAEGDSYRVVELKSNEWVSDLFDAKASWVTGKVQHSLLLPAQMEIELLGQPLYIYRPERG